MTEITQRHTSLSIQDQWIVHDDGPAMFPGIARNDRDEILCTFSTRADGLPGGEIRLVRSDDRGRNWSAPETIVEAPGPGQAAMTHLGLTRLDDGSLLLPYNEVDFNGAYEKRQSSLKLLRSTDHGDTWTTIDPTPDMHTPWMYGELVQPSPDRLLLPIWGRRDPHEPRRNGVLVSDDGGETWPTYNTIGYDPDANFDHDYTDPDVDGVSEDGGVDIEDLEDPSFRPYTQIYGFNEPTLLERGDGSILAYLRQDGVGEGLELYRSESHDGGRSWTAPEPTAFEGTSPALHRTPEGNVLLAYRRSVFDGNEPGLNVHLSPDGDNFGSPIQLRDPKGHAYTKEYQVGYPAFVNTDEGVLAVFYSYDPDVRENRYLAANLLHEA